MLHAVQWEARQAKYTSQALGYPDRRRAANLSNLNPGVLSGNAHMEHSTNKALISVETKEAPFVYFSNRLWKYGRPPAVHNNDQHAQQSHMVVKDLLYFPPLPSPSP
jgi:hypothetical protein